MELGIVGIYISPILLINHLAAQEFVKTISKIQHFPLPLEMMYFYLCNYGA